MPLRWRGTFVAVLAGWTRGSSCPAGALPPRSTHPRCPRAGRRSSRRASPPPAAPSREYRRWLDVELRGRGRSRLAGHSMGAALAILAAADSAGAGRAARPDRAGGPAAGEADPGEPARLRAPGRDAATTRAASPPRAVLAVARAPRARSRRSRRTSASSTCAASAPGSGPPASRRRSIGCVSDTLVTSGAARALAELLGARYEELDLRGGHMWMLADGERFAAVVARG